MHSSRAMHDRVIRLTLVLVSFLVLPFALGAGQDQYGGKQEFAKYVCKDETVTVKTTGVDKKAVYLCGGRTVDWVADGHNFIVIFKKNSPFVDNQKLFDNKNHKSKPAKDDTALTVYDYLIIVDGELIEDPQVVGGGGH